MRLFPFQKSAVDKAINAVHKSESLGSAHNLLISSPTGTGKSVIELSVMHELEQRVKSVILVTPRVEVIWAISRNAERLGIQSKNKLFTPITYYNKLQSGSVDTADVLLLDEAHHELAPTWRRLKPNICIIGFTATPMRGVQLETEEWRRMFTDFYEALTITEAIMGGYLTNYYYFGNTVGLLDEVIGSEAVMLRSAAQKLHQNMGLIFDWTMRLEEWKPQTRLFACPRQESVHRLCEHFKLRGSPKPVEPIIGSTRKRKELIERFQAGEIWLATVDVFTEGVDAPGAVFLDSFDNEVIWPGASSLMDLQPTSSPVKMLQIEGRIKRCLRNSGKVNSDQAAIGLKSFPPELADKPRFDIKPVAQIVPFTKNLQMHQEKLRELGVELKKRDIGGGFFVYEPNLNARISKPDEIANQQFEVRKITPHTLLFSRNNSIVRISYGLDKKRNWVVSLVPSNDAPSAYVLIGNEWKRTISDFTPIDFILIWANSTTVSYRWLETLKGEYLIEQVSPSLGVLLSLALLTELDTIGIGGRSNFFNTPGYKVQGLNAQQQDAILHVKNISMSKLFKDL